MKNMNIKYFMVLTILFISSSTMMHAESIDKEVSDKNDDKKVSFSDKMHEIKSEFRDIKKSEKDCDKISLSERLDEVAMQIDALIDEDKNASSHSIHIRTLHRQLRNARRSVEKNSLKDHGEVKDQAAEKPCA